MYLPRYLGAQGTLRGTLVSRYLEMYLSPRYLQGTLEPRYLERYIEMDKKKIKGEI
jgi:hypothetical protein